MFVRKISYRGQNNNASFSWKMKTNFACIFKFYLLYSKP